MLKALKGCVKYIYNGIIRKYFTPKEKLCE